MTIITPEDAIKAASSVARDVADGRLTPADMEAQLETELRALVGNVVGPDDPLFALQVEIARGVLAVGGVPVDELREWAAVMARREAPELISEPEVDETAPEPVSTLTVALEPDSVDPESVAEVAAVVPLPEPVPVPVVTPVRKAGAASGEYDPLAHWRPGATRRR
ncbi:hypothetical protein [Mycobacterium sp. AT1]|uniref:hypothetical protein n=1 Tax=Mycobacterium sp. AT1 TaxID=1961706 RepID=UPI0009AF189A|nr:hypothetical protein [Mycobacterium sp. AT1]OPX12488.1 hypothetical protein B1790_03295 [Mycobacterium sp. AT1]